MQKNSAFAQRLASELELQKQNPAWLSRELGVSPPTVYRWLKEGGADPQPRTRAAVAQVLRVNEAWLAGTSEEKHLTPDPLDHSGMDLSPRNERVLAHLAKLLYDLSDELIHQAPLNHEDLSSRVAMCAMALQGLANATNVK